MSSSWFPFSFNFSLPNLTPPLSIQRRFISFLLKRSLGHLLKPGQLDIDQIDAQIGRGFVEVKDLELDCTAINSLLGGQPVLLQSGTIETVTARIPWPNPFSSTVGLSLAGLRLHFCIDESISRPQDVTIVDELAESVTSVAETFIHNELTEKEEAQLRQSIHLEKGALDDIPGSMSSFLSEDTDHPNRRIDDPEGVSIFASLFESLLARFDFDASDSQISLSHNDLTFSLRVGQIRYFTTEVSNRNRNSDTMPAKGGEKRTVQISGVKITIQDHSSPLQPSSPSDAQALEQTESSSMTKESSDSELEDETQAMMSQSLVSLPPHPSSGPLRHPSPSLSTISSDSAESSMYKSAMSASGPSTSPRNPLTGGDSRTMNYTIEKTILTISESISFQLTTPSVTSRESDSEYERSPSPREGEQPLERVKLDISLGIIAILLDARCMRGLLSLADAFASVSHRRPLRGSTGSDEAGPVIFERIDLSIHLKSLVALVLGDTLDGMQDEPFISQFYERPLVPPRFAGGYVRLHVDKVSVVSTTEASPECCTPPTPFHQALASSPPFTRSPISCSSVLSCTASDFSILVFHSFRSSSGNASSDREINASSPLLITDRSLDGSYQSPSIRSGARPDRHVHPYSDVQKNTTLPVVDATDWYSEYSRTQGASLRPWRTKVSAPPRQRKPSSGLGAGLVSNLGIPLSPTRAMRNPLAINSTSMATKESSAISLKLRLGRNADRASASIGMAPLHLFVNLEMVSSLSEFVEAALPDPSGFQLNEPHVDGSDSDQEDEVPPFSPSDIAEERKRLEKLILDDLDLNMDYRQSGDSTPRRRAGPSTRKAKPHRMTKQSTVQIDVSIPLLRVQIRVPPPQKRQPRSGSLVLDLHSAHFSMHAPHSQDASRVPRFNVSGDDKAGLEEWFNGVSACQRASLEMRRVIVAYAGPHQSTAQSIISFGPISDSGSEFALDDNVRSYLLPLILFRISEAPANPASQTSPTTIVARIPSLHAVLNKASLDGLQLWVDDMSQWVERLTSRKGSGISTGVQVSRTSSLIGSRYFTQRSGSGSTESEMDGVVHSNEAMSELVVKTCLSEAFIRLVVAIDENVTLSANRLFDICTSDLDALVEVKPNGKDETVVSLNVLDASIKESSPAGSHDVLASKPLSIDRKKPAVLSLRFRSVCLPQSTAKESRIRMVLNGLTINMWSDITWITDLLVFVKAPPGAFESVIPSERTHISLDILECAFRLTPPSRPSAVVLSLGDITVSTDLVEDSHETALNTSVSDLSVLLNDDSRELLGASNLGSETDAGYWMRQGYALLANVQGLTLRLTHNAQAVPRNTQVVIEGMLLNVHLCADTISGIVGFVNDLQSLVPLNPDLPPVQRTLPKKPAQVSKSRSSTLLRSLDEQAFRRPPVIGPLPDMVNDDLPKNLEYLDASFGAAAGLRVLEEDEEEDDFYSEDHGAVSQASENIIARHGGETIRMLYSPIEIIENFFDTLTPSPLDFASEHGETSVRIRAQGCDIRLLLYDGYDWERTKRSIREEAKRVRRRLAKIRQLLASGLTYDPNVDEVNSMLFNSVYVGLEQDAEDLEGDALIAAIDDELGSEGSDVTLESSWQSFKPERRVKAGSSKAASRVSKLDREKGPSIEFSIRGMAIDFDQYLPDASLASRLLSTIRDLEILDHIKTSTWSTFLTELRSDSRGNIRETDSNMVRVELQTLQPFNGHHDQEARLKAKILPLRLHVDQDALDFLKKFFSFKDDDAAPSPPPENEIFFQHVEIFPIDIKLDYKPRRVDYKALKEGKTIELMNFFHFDGSEMTLRHITLKGVTGWPRMFDTLNDLWTPDVKANQLVDVISGVSPIRSAVNVGSGIADLILLPIAQYKKDGRIIRGLQKGTTAFVQSTAMEAIRLGARLATGTQVVLEQTENVLGGQFPGPVTAEALQVPGDSDLPSDESASAEELYSRYAEQPTNVTEGVQSAYRSLSDNIKYAGQTILAVPMEVYESGNEGPARAVIRAVPIAVLKPMIGASEAISKTLLGLHNTLDPQAQIDTETKYKHR